jgi:hypothetical protein
MSYIGWISLGHGFNDGGLLMLKKISTLLVLVLVLTGSSAYAKDVSFTLEDRDRLIRLETTMKEFKDSVDKRFEQEDKRFGDLREDMNKRFEQMFTFLWILTGIFTTMTVTVIGFAYWDRRTIITKAKEETIAEIEKDGKVRNLVSTFRELAKSDPEVAKVLRQFNLL